MPSDGPYIRLPQNRLTGNCAHSHGNSQRPGNLWAHFVGPHELMEKCLPSVIWHGCPKTPPGGLLNYISVISLFVQYSGGTGAWEVGWVHFSTSTDYVASVLTLVKSFRHFCASMKATFVQMPFQTSAILRFTCSSVMNYLNWNGLNN